VVRTEAEIKGDVTVGRGEGEVEEGGVDKDQVYERVGVVVSPGDSSVWNCEKERVVIDPVLEDGCP
jgi:hypothetical protein